VKNYLIRLLLQVGREVRTTGGVCLLIASIVLVSLQPDVGWTTHNNSPSSSDASALEQRIHRAIDAFMNQNHVIGMTVAANSLSVI
jgi:hypothetical protein